MPRKISAHYVFPINTKPIKNGVIEVDDSGRILKIINPGKEIKETAGVEFYNGILVPGFVNTHCHIELAHLKGVIPEYSGLHHFISQISKIRIADKETISKAIKNADWEMQKNGIVAVGDISNTNYSIATKKNSKISYHTFVELFSLNPEKAKAIFKTGEKLKKAIKTISAMVILINCIK